jgi:NADH-quinone oxidoreductase subunit N
METDLRTITSILPETTLAIAAVLIAVGGAFVRSATSWITLTATALVAAAVLLAQQPIPSPGHGIPLATGPFWFDALSGTWRWAALGFGAVLLLSMARPASRDRGGESLGMLLLIVAGLMLAVSSLDLVVVFLALELISIPTYVLLFLGRNGMGAIESTTKYFFLSILSSAFFLMGLALLYGLAGDLTLPQVFEALQQGNAADKSAVALLAVMLLVAGLGFKITAVPFHFYAPDVYLATTNFNAGLLAVVPKVAGLIVMARLLPAFSPVFPELNSRLLIVISLLTMTIGNVGALLQTNFRRMMAFSSVAHSGYMLIGVAVGLSSVSQAVAYDGFSAAQFYLLVYGCASLGAFAVMCELEPDGASPGAIRDLGGLAQRRPWMAGAMAVCMFSLAGLPPFAGFWGKLTLFSSALTAHRQLGESSWFLVLAVVGVLNAAVAAAYYLRVIGAVYFSQEAMSHKEAPRGFGLSAVAAVICGLLVVVSGLVPGGIVGYFQQLDVRPVQSVAADSPILESDRALEQGAG